MSDLETNEQDNNQRAADVATKKKQLAFTNDLLFQTPGGIRFTQDSPILPNVWLAFALEPRSQQELILTSTNDIGAGVVSRELRRMLMELRKARPSVLDKNGNEIQRKKARVAYIPGQMAVKLYFDEMMRVVLPLTPWWHETYDALRRLQHTAPEDVNVADWEPFPAPDKQREEDLFDAMMLMRREIDPSVFQSPRKSNAREISENRISYVGAIPPSLTWLVRISGLIADCFLNGKDFFQEPDSLSSLLEQDFEALKSDRIERSIDRDARIEKARLAYENAEKVRLGIVKAFVDLYDGWAADRNWPEDRVIWRVTKNRRVHLAVQKSALTVKADAARHLFNISCEKITWAVLDSGIDSTHPAFKKTTEAHEEEMRKLLGGEGKNTRAEELPVDKLQSRVVQTLDFTFLRELLGLDDQIDETEDEEDKRRRELLRKRIALQRSVAKCGCKQNRDPNPCDKHLGEAREVLNSIRKRIRQGREISWPELEQAIVTKHPSTPTNDHGTHVAGILGADWIEDFETERILPLAQRTRRMQGICPDINLIDVRVFREDGLTDEFELLAALQFLRWMNSRAGTMQVHGANLSLSLVHEVRRFACGQTPICEECNEASALGMVIVAAAGNRGFQMADADTIRASDSYKSVSITDPGNADSVITVGSTHRKRPHEYGVSYFSSRGPTGDGRLKPDVVAPGEKIKGPTPNGREEFKDGTSMAAPHVSGIAALLMARHGELVARPERIKQILCDTATDLGREKYFQGHGLVDALRALQSV